MHVGIVAEGPCDLAFLEALVGAVSPGARVTRIQPEATLGAAGSGWQGVRGWCKEFGPRLQDFLELETGNPIDVLVVQVDCSMSQNVEARCPCPPAGDTGEALRAVVLTEWLGLQAQPDWLKLATPCESTDTWLASVMAPPENLQVPLECAPTSVIDDALARAGLFPRQGGGVKKSVRLYKAASLQAVADLPTMRGSCVEADRFIGELS